MWVVRPSSLPTVVICLGKVGDAVVAEASKGTSRSLLKYPPPTRASENLQQIIVEKFNGLKIIPVLCLSVSLYYLTAMLLSKCLGTPQIAFIMVHGHVTGSDIRWVGCRMSCRCMLYQILLCDMLFG